jgi:hypothetical protein
VPQPKTSKKSNYNKVKNSTVQNMKKWYIMTPYYQCTQQNVIETRREERSSNIVALKNVIHGVPGGMCQTSGGGYLC